MSEHDPLTVYQVSFGMLARMRYWQRVIVCVGLWCALASGASANERYAAFVVDAQTQEVLHARNADAPRYPASLTKMMTLYMLFSALDAGDVSLDDQLLVSPEAASRPASHLGLEAGDRIRAEEAILALIVKSANDVAVVVAEHLSGDEARFAGAMTEKAHELGLSQTMFKNASGLPDPGQVTTARDLARLAYALHRDFPQYYHYFATEDFTWQGRRYHTHHGLLGRVEGVDGLKTGYIRASGFNVAVSAERQDHSLIAVVMGGRTSATRDAHAQSLIESAFTALEGQAQSLRLASLNVPRLNPIREERILTAELTQVSAPREMGSAAGGAPAVTIESVAPTLYTEVPPPSFDPRYAWSLQVGAFGTQAAAQARLETVRHQVGTPLTTAGFETESLQQNGRTLWRARFTNLAGDQARVICTQLAARGESCFAVAP